MSGFAVRQPGIFTTLQDSGRIGQSHHGVTSGGAMDRPSLAWANHLTGNHEDTGGLEITIGGLELQSLINTRIAICGADCPVTINGKSVGMWRSHAVHYGDIIYIGHARTGCRSYMTTAGGFLLPRQFGSHSTVVREQLGGLNGTALKRGDFLPCLHHSHKGLRQAIDPPEALHSHSDSTTKALKLRIIPSYQHDEFSEQQREHFFNSRYQVSRQCDRMGYRLQGPAITHQQHQLYSEGISYGAVQIPPDGQPIVLLNDRQTIGGYPKIGTVLSIDCYPLAQRQAGAGVRFELIDIEAAQVLIEQAMTRKKQSKLIED